jgi:hypothetical protein
LNTAREILGGKAQVIKNKNKSRSYEINKPWKMRLISVGFTY